jgi:hypothetical protein
MPDGASPERIRSNAQAILQSENDLRGEAEGEVADYAFHAKFDDITAAAIADAANNLQSLVEAKLRSDWPRWKKAMDREIATLEAAGTWTEVPRSSDKNVVGSKRVFRIKHKANGTINKYKA